MKIAESKSSSQNAVLGNRHIASIQPGHAQKHFELPAIHLKLLLDADEVA